MPKKRAKKKAPGKKVAKRAGPGRPPVEVDEEQVAQLAGLGCTAEEIASVVGCGRRTIFDRFSHCLEKGYNERKMSLRREQTALALSGDKTMLIWLGKQELGQCEPQRVIAMGDEQPRVAGLTPDQFEESTVKLIFAEIQKRKISRGKQ